MKIKNPVLRSAAGLAVLALGGAALVGLFYGLGLLMEPWYAQMFPYSYAESGYGFWKAVGQGFLGLYVLLASGMVVFLVGRFSLTLGNRLFGSKN